MFHILAADDDKNMRRLLRAVPEAEHHTVSAACGGEDAHKVMEREHIDPVVPDIMMPRMDGHAFASLLRGARTPARGQMEQKGSGAASGFQGAFHLGQAHGKFFDLTSVYSHGIIQK